ncbi:MAG: hypothetical protein WDN24_13265 [Sphingomonas sp.]
MGIGLCVLRGRYVVALLSVALLASIWAYIFNFAVQTSQPFVWAAGGEYVGIGLLGLFFLAGENGGFDKLIRWYFWISFGYACIYLLSSYALSWGMLQIDVEARILVSADDVGRGDRLFLASAPIIFGLAYCLTHFSKKNMALYAVPLMVFVATLIVSNSRTVTALTLLFAVAYFLVRNIRLIAWGGFAGYAIGVLLSIMIMFRPELNPFRQFDESSAYVRVMALEYVRSVIDHYWITGAGISFGEAAYSPLTGNRYFYPSDIGMVGILYIYGIAGLLFYILLSLTGCFSYHPLRKLGYRPLVGEVMSLTGVILATYSLQAPLYNGQSGDLLAALYGAIALRAYRVDFGIAGGARMNPSLPRGPASAAPLAGGVRG